MSTIEPHPQLQYPIVCVGWRDSHSNHGWKDRETGYSDLAPIVTIGFVLKDNENRLVLSAETWNPTDHTKQRHVVELPPLDPQAASIVVADVFNFDCDRLFSRFQENWGSLEDTVITGNLKTAIRLHELVHQLQRCSATE